MSHAAYRAYMEDAHDHEAAGRIDAAWACLEAAHVLGQSTTLSHVVAHRSMLSLACRQRDYREIIGQVFRFIAAAAITWLWVPAGNIGRARVSAFRSQSIPGDLAMLLDRKMNVTIRTRSS